MWSCRNWNRKSGGASTCRSAPAWPSCTRRSGWRWVWKFFESYEFHILGRSYGDPAFDDDRTARRVYKAVSQRLETVIARGVERFLYLFDSTDQWRHDVIVEQVRKGDAGAEYPAFVDGARRCPPEKVGGTLGFMGFLEAMLNPFHEKHVRMREWYRGGFDPDDIDEREVRIVIQNIARRRRGALAGRGRHLRGRAEGE